MTEKFKEQITYKAREFATAYTNRHFPNEPAFAFGNEGWAKFVDALVELAGTHPNKGTSALPFPVRIMDQLQEIARREDTEHYGSWTDGNGEPLQDDADAAIAWIKAAAPVVPAPGAIPARIHVTEAMHRAAVKVLHRASGLDGLPQRMMDAMLSAIAPPAAPGVQGGEVRFGGRCEKHLSPKPCAACAQSPQQSAQPDVPETDCGNIAQPVAEVVQMNQSRYFSCLATSETTTPQIGAKLYAAPQPEEVQRHAVSLSKDRQNRIYIAGPMTGYAEFNFPAFNVMADKLRAQGFHVENPAEHGIVDGAEWADYLHYDIGRLATCAYLMLLPGWSKSKGAALEVSIAKGLGMGVNFAEGAEAQPVEVPLTAGEIEAIAKPFIRTVGGYSQNEPAIPDNGKIEDFVQAVEAAHGIKPTGTEGGAA